MIEPALPVASVFPPADHRPADAPIRVINYRLLLVTALVLVVLTPAAYFWRGYQVQRNSSALLARALAARERKQWPRAIECYQRYLQLRPHDLDARAEYAKTIDQGARNSADKRNAWRRYAQVIGLAPERMDLQARYAQLSLELGAFAIAESAAQRVLGVDSKNATALKVLASSQYYLAQSTGRSDRLASIVPLFESALARQPEDVELTLQLADVLRQMKEAERADALVDRVVQASGESVEALMARYHYRRQHHLGTADSDLDQALAKAPQDAKVLLTAADRALRAARLDEARRYSDEAIAAAPTQVENYLAAGRIRLAQGQRDEAVEIWQRGLKKVGADNVFLNLEASRVLLATHKLDDAERHLGATERALRDLSLQLPEQQRGRLTQLQGTVAYLWGVLEAEQGDFHRAVPHLERALVVFQPTQRVGAEMMPRYQALMKLGECYAHLEEWDLAAGVFQEAASLQPDSVQAALAAGDMWQRAGRFDLASEQYDKVLHQKAASPEDWAVWAYNKLRHELSLPAEERSLPECESVLSKAKEQAPDSVRLALLEAEFRALQERHEDALAICEKLRDAHPESVDLWRFLTLAYQQWGYPAKALQAVESLKKLSTVSRGDQTLLEAELLSLRKEYGAAEKLLREALPAFEEGERKRGNLRLATVLLEQGKRREAIELLERLTNESPGDVELQRRLAELAWEAGDTKLLGRSAAQLEKLEGANGTWWRFYRAEQLLGEATSASSPAGREAARLTADVSTRRPRWSRAAVLRGDVARLEGRNTEALEQYAQAAQLGDQSLKVLERLVTALYAENRFEEAQQHLASFDDPTLQSPELSVLAISLSMRQGETSQAIALAREAAARWPDDAMQQIWLGQVLALAKQNDEATAAFRAAIDRAPQDPRTWGAMLNYLLRDEKPDAARELLAEAARSEKLPRGERELLLAQGNQQLGNQQEAATHFALAAQAAPGRASIQLLAADYFLQRDGARAEQYLRAAMRGDASDSRPRMRLARLLFQRGGEQAWNEAMQLVSGVDATADERRLQVALYLSREGKDHRQNAIRILDQLTRDGSATAADRLTLGRLYEQDGRLEKAREQLLAAASPETADPAAVAGFVDLALRQNQADTATPYLERLQEKDPNSIRTLALRAKWLAQKGRAGEIVSTIGPVVDRQVAAAETAEAKARLLNDLGMVYSQSGLQADAERVLRQGREASPELYEPLAMWLASVGRVGEAVDLILEEVDLSNADELRAGALFAANLLASQQPTKEVSERIEPLLERALRVHANEVDLLYAIANLRYLQQREADAAALYRRVVQLAPSHALALNNLGMVLATDESRRAEARELVSQAINLAGREPQFLDSLGMILLYDGKETEAVEVLREAASGAKNDPRLLLHLAAAYQRSKSTREARDTLAAAMENKLAEAPLSPSEAKLLDELRQGLNQ